MIFFKVGEHSALGSGTSQARNWAQGSGKDFYQGLFSPAPMMPVFVCCYCFVLGFLRQDFSVTLDPVLELTL